MNFPDRKRETRVMVVGAVVPMLALPNPAETGATTPMPGVAPGGDGTHLSPREPGPLLPASHLQALAENYAPVGSDVPGDRLQASGLPEGETRQASRVSEAERGGSSRGLEQGPAYGNESVEMPGQVGGGTGQRLVLDQDKPREAQSLLAQERARQEISESSAAGQSDRSGALEASLALKKQSLEDGHRSMQRGQVQDALQLAEGQAAVADHGQQADDLGQHQQSVSAMLEQGQANQSQLESTEQGERQKISPASERSRQLEANQRVLGGMAERSPRSPSLVKGNGDAVQAMRRAQEDEKSLQRSLSTAGYKRNQAAQKVVFLRDNQNRATQRRERVEQQRARAQDRLQADQTTFQERQKGEADVQQRVASQGRQQDNARRSHQANRVNQEAARSNSLYLRQVADTFGAQPDRLQRTPTEQPLPNTPGQSQGQEPNTTRSGNMMFLELRALNGAQGSMDSLAGVGSGNAAGTADSAVPNLSAPAAATPAGTTTSRASLSRVAPLVQAGSSGASSGSGSSPVPLAAAPVPGPGATPPKPQTGATSGVS